MFRNVPECSMFLILSTNHFDGFSALITLFWKFVLVCKLPNYSRAVYVWSINEICRFLCDWCFLTAMLEIVSFWFHCKVIRQLQQRPFYGCVISYLANEMNASKAGGDLALIQISLPFSFKCQLVSIRTTWFTQQKQWRLSVIETRWGSRATSVPFKGQVVEQTTAKWPISD